MNSNPFMFTEKKIDENKFLYMLNIEDITPLHSYIDQTIIKICKGNRNVKIDTVKKEVFDYLESKKKSNLYTGSVAEFFIHLFLNSIEYKQEFLYLNLEENSIKKGFDGYYTINDEQWILESKSGVLSVTNPIKHSYKINEAYNGLRDKIEGVDNSNNPWENAYNHAAHINVGTKTNVIDVIDKLSQDYTNDVYRKIIDFNIIPCSTIFLDEKWDIINDEELVSEVTNNIKSKDFAKIIIICVNKKSLESLFEYLKNQVC